MYLRSEVTLRLLSLKAQYTPVRLRKHSSMLKEMSKVTGVPWKEQMSHPEHLLASRQCFEHITQSDD